MRRHGAKRLLLVTALVTGTATVCRSAAAQQTEPQTAAPAVAKGTTAEGNQNPSVAPANLAGLWFLDPEQSEDAKQKLRDAMGSRPNGAGPRGGGPPMGGPGGRGGGPGLGGPGGRRFGGPPDGSADSERHDMMRSFLEPPVEIAITPTDQEIAIVEKDGRLRTLHPDGKKYRTEGGSVEIKTRWDKSRLVVESRGPRDEKITETYDLTNDRSRLTITARLERSPMPAVTVRRVYSATAPKQPSPAIQ